ncbi:hypothetical protein JG688_00006437, partial [Phytophthora aleatoria]
LEGRFAQQTANESARRSRYIITLTIWKNREATINIINYRACFSYGFEKIHSLKLLYGNPCASFQIQARLQAVPLSTPVLVVDDTDNRARGEVIQSDPDAHMRLEGKPEISTSATQISAKHKNRMGSLQDEVGDPILGSPTRGRERDARGSCLRARNLTIRSSYFFGLS